VPIATFGQKSTYNCNIPMETTLIFGVPPYEIHEFTTVIEMSTNTKVNDPEDGRLGVVRLLAVHMLATMGQ
jgi:hypothetical protein